MSATAAIPRIRLHGLLGKALERSCSCRLKNVDYRQLTEPFRLRNETDNGWRCEFWGKIVRSAILTNHSLQDAELAELIKSTVRDIMSAQTHDGCISSYPTEKQLDGWDVWGRKYVLLGLLRYYDFVEQDEEVRNCCVRLLDHLMSQIGPSGVSILDCGLHDGLAASSILGAVVGVYRITGERRFLDFAKYIVQTGCSKKHDVFKAVRNGVIPKDLGNGKAYEMTSCFQGLAELYTFEAKPEYREACVQYFEAVRAREIFVNGVGGGKDACGEYWDDGAWKQTQSDYQAGLGETCVTTTWLHYCEKIAEMTASTVSADEMERSLYNGILGAMAPDGSHWTHANPRLLGGFKQAPDDQIQHCFGSPYGGNDCCRAQGPEALALAPRLAVMRLGDSVCLNLFEPLRADIAGVAKIEVAGKYPLESAVPIRIVAEQPFELDLRVPGNLQKATLNGNPLQFEPGSRLKLTRKWSADDRLELQFDLSVREIVSPDGACHAFQRGPLILAEDSRGMVPHALCQEECRGHRLIDYITAGDGMCEENTLKVWF